LVQSAAFGDSLEVLRSLVKDLGADVNQPRAEDGYTPLLAASFKGELEAVKCLVEELGADVNKPEAKGITPLSAAAQCGHIDVMRCLVKEWGANVNQASQQGGTPLLIAIQLGNMPIVQCLVKELGADIHQADNRGGTPLMTASHCKHASIVKWLIKAGADPQASAPWGTAADVSKDAGASTEQTSYLEAKTHCSNVGCIGAGILKCTGCKQARYCGEPCQLAHWKAHKADCKRWSAERSSN
jgi:ankyrin repeat protein